ncbi:hypothetical protein ACEZCY_19145 [Streptacidiphilus sp. N1-12]|uniref:Uncharacterized protein n=2 Tax=Streptacidiphilus alkalitolerans TaxID=3342712 RepID=A0ABV6WH15_9ACTN
MYAIHTQCDVPLLLAQRLAHDWTLDTAVTEYLRVCARAGISEAKLSPQQLSMFETGRSTPSSTNLDRLCRLYATRPDRLGFGSDYSTSADDGPTPAPAFRIGRRPRETTAPPGRTTHRRDILRGLLAGAGVAISGAVLDVLADARHSMTDTLESASVGENTLDQLERTAVEYGYAYQVSPPATLLAESVQDFLDTHALLERRQSADVRIRLCRVAAQLAGTAGIALVALGEHREARAWFRTAQVAAEETGDRALRAWLYAREAVIPFYYGTPQAALALAERARVVAGKTNCATAAWAPSLEARSLARMGRGADAAAAMQLSQAAFARLGDDQIGDTAYGYTERQLRWHEGSMYTVLGDTRRAQLALDAAWNLYAPTEHLDRALIAFDQATCLLRVGEVTMACRQAELILGAVPPQHLTGIVISRCGDLISVVPQRAARQPAVRQLRELVTATGRPELTQ